MSPEDRMQWVFERCPSTAKSPGNGALRVLIVEAIRATENEATELAAKLADENWNGSEPGSPGDYIRAMMQPSN